MAWVDGGMKYRIDQGRCNTTVTHHQTTRFEHNWPSSSGFNLSRPVRWLVRRIQLLFAVEGFWLQIGQNFLDVLKRPKLSRIR